MSIFKRLSATVFSRVDSVVSEIENHDAIIDAAIRDNKRALARARVRFNRLRADGLRMQQQLESLRESEATWTRRAREQAHTDEQTALQCLQKRRDCRRRINSLENMLAEHRQAETRLAGELEIMEERIRKVTQQKNLLRTRESTADAMRTFRAIESCSHIDIDDTFEKWEVKVAEAELDSESIAAHDTLEEQFIDAEETRDLKAELHELTREAADEH